MNDMRTTSRIVRKEHLRTKACSNFMRCMLFVALPAGLTASSPSAIGADESGPMGVATSASNARAYFLQPRDVVLFLGNSITAGAKPEIDFLVEDFKQQYPELADGDGKVKLITSGISGEQAVGGAGRLKGLLDQHKPTVCVVCYGTCEITHKNEASFTPAMKDIVHQLREAKAAITIVSPPPPSSKNWRQSPPAEQFVNGLPKMAAQAKQIAAEEGVPFVDAFTALKTLADKNNKELTSDGIHLNRDGYRAMADALQQTWEFGNPLAKPNSRRSLPPALGPKTK
jgi:lysophospholipase L1-like esterase